MTDSPALFEARTAPLRSLDDRGLLLVLILLSAGFTFGGTVMTLMGAWPVTIFAGVEVLVVAGLLLLYRAHARHAREFVVLVEGALIIRRREGRREEEATFDPYWARLGWEEGRRLVVCHRSRCMEIGRFLPPDDKRDLERALGAALRRYREPTFPPPG